MVGGPRAGDQAQDLPGLPASDQPARQATHWRDAPAGLSSCASDWPRPGQQCLAAAPAVRLPEDDVAPVDVRHWVSDDVLEVEPSRGSLESAGAAAFNYRVVAAPENLYPGGYVRIKFGLELVSCRESAHGSAVQAAHEDLFAAFQVDPARRLLRCDDLRVQTAVEAARHQESGIADEVLIPRRRAWALHSGGIGRIPRNLGRGISSHGIHKQQSDHRPYQQPESSHRGVHNAPPNPSEWTGNTVRVGPLAGNAPVCGSRTCCRFPPQALALLLPSTATRVSAGETENVCRLYGDRRRCGVHRAATPPIRI